MILRLLLAFALIWSVNLTAVTAQSDGLSSFTDAQIAQFVRTDQQLGREKQELVYNYRTLGNLIAANRAQEELDEINARLQSYNLELERRRARTESSVTHESGKGTSGTVGNAYGAGTTTTETNNTSRSEITERGYGGGGQQWVAPEWRNGINVGTEVYQNQHFSTGPGGTQSGYSRSSVTTNEDGSTVSEHEFYKVGIQNTQRWVSNGGGGNNMPPPASGGGGGGGYAPGGPGGLGLAPGGQDVDYDEPQDDTERDKKGPPEKATIEGDETPKAKEGECDGGIVFCGIGLKEGANYTGNKLDEVNGGEGVGITTNVNMKKLIIGWIKFFLAVIAVIAVIALIYAGILMIVHLGDDSQIEKAKKIIIWGVVGIVLVFLAFAIVNTLTILADPENSESGDGAFHPPNKISDEPFV